MECERCNDNFDFLIQCIHQTEVDKRCEGHHATFIYLCKECIEVCVRRRPPPSPTQRSKEKQEVIP